MSLRPIDTSWLDRMNARKMARPEVDRNCRICLATIRVRDGFDPICPKCEDEQMSPSAKLFQHHASIDRRPAVMEDGEVPIRYRTSFVDLAVWPVDPLRPADLREWPRLEVDRTVKEGEPWALTIRGDFETGKTRLAVELAVRQALRRRTTMLFASAAAVADAVHDPDPQAYSRLTRVPILVVDDLGRSYSGGQGQAVQRLICDRYNWLRTTLFTTNADESGFDDPAVMIRLGEGLQVEMTPANRGRS